MRCPYCGADGTQVKDSRPSEDGASIRRRRVCVVCGGRFTTFERVQLRELVVVKRNNRREPFDREKLQRSVEIACRKRPVGEERIERMVSGIVRQLEAGGESEVAAEAIGNLVMEALKTVDDVAYVRFASVYRNFREAKDFEAFVGELARTVGLDRPRGGEAGEGDQPELPGAAPRAPPLDLRRSAGAREGEPAAERTAAPSATGEADDGDIGAAAPEEDRAARRGAGRATGPSSTAAPGAYDDSMVGEDDAGGPRRAGAGASGFGEQMPLLEERPDDDAARGAADGDPVAGRRPPPRGRKGAGRGRTRSNGRAAGGDDPTDDTDT